MTTATAEISTEAARKRIELHDGQTVIFQTDARFVALIAGTGGGKTFTGPYWLSKEIAKNPKGIYGVGAPTYRMLSRVTAAELVRAFRGTTLEGEHKASLGEYHLPTGGIIYLWSTDNPDHIEGGQYDAIWLDEAGQMSAWTWTVVQARLGLKQGRCLFTTTPYNLGWLYREIYARAKEGDKDYFVSQFPSTDNPYYPQDEFARAEASMDERTFALRYRGEFRKMAGLVWPNLDNWVCQEDELQVALQTAEDAPESTTWVGGIDWGYNNPFVALSGFVDRDDVLWVYRERCQTRTLLADHAKHLDKRTSYYADPSGRQEREEMGALGVVVQPSDNDVQMGIERVTQRGKTGRLMISPECRNLISEAETYRYKEETDKPVKEHDHAVDALRYLVMGVDGRPAPKIISLNYGEEKDEDIILSDNPSIWRSY